MARNRHGSRIAKKKGGWVEWGPTAVAHIYVCIAKGLAGWVGLPRNRDNEFVGPIPIHTARKLLHTSQASSKRMI